MKHLGDITKISGFDVPVTDCVIGGSPCQDLSVAGRREGLQGERSGLFMEQIRVIKEMRENDRRSGRSAHLIRPRFMLWENVPGAFSSAKGEDFKAVLEETIRIAEPNAPDIPLPPKGKWPMADCWYGDTWSIAYRVLDAQFWGVPQRRRRIALVADFGGHAAPEILFIRKGVCGYPEESAEQGQTDTAGTGAGTAETVFCIQGNCIDRADTAGCNGRGWTTDVSYTLNTIDRPAVASIHMTQDPIVSVDKTPCLSSGNPRNGQCGIAVFAKTTRPHSVKEAPTYEKKDVAPTLNVFDMGESRASVLVAQSLYENHGQDSRLTGPLETAPTISQKFGTGGNNTPLVVQAAGFKPNQGAKAHGIGYQEEVSPTLNTDSLPPAVLQKTIEKPYCIGNGQANQVNLSETVRSLSCMHDQQAVIAPTVANEIVRRLTPLECERLQGYPDGWTDIGEWIDSKGKLHKEVSDSARYKALGNSIALPPWRWVIKRLCGCYERAATMASLFDGIGGFPLIWEQFNGKGSVLWASEIEEFPIAVTMKRFPEEER